ncbi:MAG: signal recognition particle-docking protein FtsY [Candidatus Pacearchaeota archaeon]|nr:signal recognition particle-docking protein FtsY [Candidatus Pacearchaeota archaeon]
MFKFLKERLQRLFKKTEEELEKKEEKKESIIEKIFKPIITVKLDEKNFENFFSEFEIILIESNAAIEVIDFLKTQLKKDLVGKEIKRKEIREEIRETTKNAILGLFPEPFDIVKKIEEKKEKPYVIVFFGINGTGKTLSIAKLAYFLKSKGINCVLAASDTFRAASIEQLEKHAEKLNLKIIKHKYGSDPAAVAFDAIAHARAHGIHAVLIDTAGRMHTDKDLLKEMEKIVRVSKPDLKIFVGEAIAGNDVIQQAKTFNETVGIDGIILTKADVDEKGGACISISYITKKPILFLGTGQNYQDFERFEKDSFIKKIFI